MRLKNIVLGLLGISLVVGIHELGHWSMCKLFNVGTPRFSIGFGPVLLEKKIGTTVFSLSALPIGGYVEITGMRTPEPGREEESFSTKPFFQKAIIMLGGIAFNILFALIVLLIVGFAPPLKREQGPESDILLTDEQRTPQPRQQEGIVGPLGVIQMSSQSASYGTRFYFFFLAILSLNLAVFNLLPLPILDGGQLLIFSIEAARGHQLSSQTYNLIMTLTTIFIMFTLFYVTSKDIHRATQ